MIEPKLFDTVELLVDLPEDDLRAGARGAIVHQHTDDVFEVEFMNEDGETLALCALPYRQFIVVWQAESQRWVTVAEQVAQIIARLPEDARAEVLDFAQFLSTRTQQPHSTMARHAAVQS
jgi:hypothetical protein